MSSETISGNKFENLLLRWNRSWKPIYGKDAMQFVQNGKNCENMWSGSQTKVEQILRITNNHYFMNVHQFRSTIFWCRDENLGINRFRISICDNFFTFQIASEFSACHNIQLTNLEFSHWFSMQWNTTLNLSDHLSNNIEIKTKMKSKIESTFKCKNSKIKNSKSKWNHWCRRYHCGG